jgi:hypothetical protein
MPACLHACMPACLHACMPACLHACMPACLHACAPARLRACAPARLRACAPARLRACAPARLRACAPACIPPLHACHCMPATACLPALPDTCRRGFAVASSSAASGVQHARSACRQGDDVRVRVVVGERRDRCRPLDSYEVVLAPKLSPPILVPTPLSPCRPLHLT